MHSDRNVSTDNLVTAPHQQAQETNFGTQRTENQAICPGATRLPFIYYAKNIIRLACVFAQASDLCGVRLQVRLLVRTFFCDGLLLLPVKTALHLV